MLCYVMLCHVMSCHVMSCHVLSCYVMLCYVMLCYVMTTVNSLHVRESKTVLDSKIPLPGIRITRYWIPDSQCQWKLDSRFQSLVGFRISCAVFQILLTRKNFLDSGSSVRPYMGRSYTLSHSQEKFPLPCDINRCDEIAVIIIIIKKVASTAFL